MAHASILLHTVHIRSPAHLMYLDSITFKKDFNNNYRTVTSSLSRLNYSGKLVTFAGFSIFALKICVA